MSRRNAAGYTKPDARVRAVVEARIVELRKQQDAHGKHDELWQRFNDRLYEVMLIREALSALDTPATESAPALRGSDDKLAREAAERIIAETERRLRDYPITPEWKDADTVARAYLSAATTRDAVLEEALSEMIYETTHLSAPDEDGAHRCKISKATLEKARRALKSGAGEGGAA